MDMGHSPVWQDPGAARSSLQFGQDEVWPVKEVKGLSMMPLFNSCLDGLPARHPDTRPHIGSEVMGKARNGAASHKQLVGAV